MIRNLVECIFFDNNSLYLGVFEVARVLCTRPRALKRGHSVNNSPPNSSPFGYRRLFTQTTMLLIRGLSFVKRVQTLCRTISPSTCGSSGYLSENHGYTQPNTPRSLRLMQARHLFTDEVLGIDKLNKLRQSKSNFYGAAGERYINRLKEYLQRGETKSIFAEDLHNLIGLANSEEQYDLLEELALLMKSESHINLAYAGVNIMRLYLCKGQVNRAFRNIKDYEKFGSLFSLMSSYQIVMTMLFREGRYQDLLEVFQISRQRLTLEGDKPPRRLAVIAFAAYAKIGTEEALEEAERLFSEDESNLILKKKVVSFLAYTCYKLGRYTDSLNWLTQVAQSRYVTNREIKALSLAHLKRFEDLDFHLRGTMNNIQPTFTLLTRSTFNEVQSCLGDVEDSNLRESLSDILIQAESDGLINDQSSLEELIFNPIVPRDPNQQQQYQQQKQPPQQARERRRRDTEYQPNRADRTFSADRPRRVFNEEKQTGY